MKSFCSLSFFCFIALIISGLQCSNLVAASQYVLPNGAGAKDGSSWENARSGADGNFQAAWDALNPGDTLYIGSGTYKNAKIVSSQSGEEGKPLRLVGEDRGSGLPLVTSHFDKNKPSKTGATFFEAKLGTTNFEIEGIRFKNYKVCVHLRGRHKNVNISKLDIEGVREGIRSEGGGTPENPDAGTHDVIVSDCRMVNFTKRAIRMEGGNYNWKIQRCYADAGGKEWATEPFQICFQVAKKKLKGIASYEHDIEYMDCVALNAYSESTSKAKTSDTSKLYWNGDGFTAESGAKKLRYIRCVSMHHTDGGWDDKSEAPEFIDCVALDNKENFRFWCTSSKAKMRNCLSAYAYKRGGTGKAGGIWTRSSIEGENCTFIDNGSSQILMDIEKNPNLQIVFKNSIFMSSPGSNSVAELGPHFKVENSIVWENGTDETNPQIKATSKTSWKTGTTAYDSTKFPSEGFSITRWNKKKS